LDFSRDENGISFPKMAAIKMPVPNGINLSVAWAAFAAFELMFAFNFNEL